MAEEFKDYIARERDRLTAERDAVLSQQRELEAKLASINNEFRAIDVYEAAKSGKTLAPTRASRGGGQRATRRGSRREAIIAVIRETPEGLSRGELLEKMGLKGDKSGEMSVSNALTALTKANQVSREGGKYRVAA
jgi:hypothetical protein